MGLYLGTEKVASGAIYGSKNKILDEYSKAEIKTNKVWVDGKPIYRKVIISKTPSDSNWGSISLNISDAETITSKDVSFESSGRVFDGSYYESSDYYSYYSIDKTNSILQIRVCSLFYNKDLRIVLEYTKTTDAVASGFIQEQTSKSIDIYSDEEMVVGTWYDKPLYRKVVKYTLAEPTSYPSYPSFDTGIRNIEYAMIDVYFSNGTSNLEYFRNRSTFDGYLQKSTGKYHFILQNNVASSAIAGLYVFVFQYTKTTD